MEQVIKPTKEKVADTAVQLFYTKGFHGTSVRDIAKKASVNVSMISYYFKNKQGLLEYLVVRYYEEYLDVVEQQIFERNLHEDVSDFLYLIDAIIQYKQKHHQFTCFIQRELSFDNMFIRELLVTYLAKEQYLLQNAFYSILPDFAYTVIEKECLYMQFKGLLNIPFLMPHEWKQNVQGNYSEQAYLSTYIQMLKNWLSTVWTIS
ncbi:forespore capture DNA-binding protein RefZ [Salirhabdus salicampi]|uniref:forespore capture DNA-binding protein RefZ n=1 Tax=Salirhabdus salicampi TaxID=476102 RepID=UPI0020C4C865|nr:forespore capture DNA-binding protein RefZ [Salirhabdus salicampi]MCP8617132.1 forespore capture DNA-binding protein RefZ [Salirhabdus salicampi]